MHRLLLANAIAQAEAFCVGRSEAEVILEMKSAGIEGEDIRRIAPHRSFSGGRPSAFYLADDLDARSLGALVSAYEHKVFLEGLIWNVFSYDQWGVELGKKLARQLLGKPDQGNWTAGTQALIDQM